MSERKQKTEPWNYDYGSYDKEDKKDGRWSKAKRNLAKTVLTLAALGGAVGVGHAMEKSIKADNAEEIKVMNEKFEPILAPAAQDAAKFALDKAQQYKDKGDKRNHGDIYEVSGKTGIDFSTEVNGVQYRVSVIVDRDTQGNPDPSKVSRAEIWETSERAANPSGILRKIEVESPEANGKGYWGGSMVTDDLTAKNPSRMSSRETYNYGGADDDLEGDIVYARSINKHIHDQLTTIEKVS